MKLILQEKIVKLGNIGDQVNVKPGYGRNFLIPYGKAVPATPAYIKQFEARRAEFEKKEADQLAAAQERAKAIEGLSLSMEAIASDEGKLFGSIGPREIAEAAEKAGVECHKNEVRMPEGPVRQVGEFEIVVSLHSDVDATLKLAVIAAK